jgi:type IV secretory pathway protease TraF
MRTALRWGSVLAIVQSLAIYLGTQMVLTLTPSLPVGLYWRLGLPTTLVRGITVELTPPDRLFTVLPQATRPRVTTMLKQVGAVEGEEVCWNEGAMIAAGQTWTRYPTHLLAAGLVGCRTLEPDEVVLVGEHPRSCDSRDFGPVHRGHILGAVIPLWTWGQ